MDPTGIVSALFAGIVIGLIARILVPSMQPIGCIVTIIIGILGAFLGLAVGNYLGIEGNWGWLMIFAIQVFIATILVAITAFLFRRAGSG